MKPLILRELRNRRRSLATWAIALGAAGAFYMLLWPSIEDSVGQTITHYPESIKAAFGVGTLSSPEEFLSFEQFSLILPFAMGVFAIRAVAAAIDGAQERGYLDVLLSAPVSRRAVASSTFVVIAIEAAAILTVAWAASCLASVVVGAGLDPGLAAAGFGNVWPLAMFSAGVAMLLTGLTRSSGLVTGAACGTLVAMYLVDLVARLSDSVDALRYVSIFHYYGTAGVDGITPLSFAGMTVAGAALGFTGSWLLDRRDIAA